MGAVCGYASSDSRLRRRISAGSIPRRAAARSISPSVTVTAIGWPTPRYWQVGVLVCSATRSRALYAGSRYQEPVRFSTWLPSTADVRGYTEYGPIPVRSSISNASSRPSGDTASRPSTT